MYSFLFLSHISMKMKLTFLFAALLPFAATFAQTSYGIKKIYAYYEEHMPGNIPVDENGNPRKKYPIIAHRIFVETISKTKIEWETAWKDGKTFSISTTEINQFPF